MGAHISGSTWCKFAECEMTSFSDREVAMARVLFLATAALCGMPKLKAVYVVVVVVVVCKCSCGCRCMCCE